MIDKPISGAGGSPAVRLESLPKTALQAIYHAVTGKTENLSKEINGNVIINIADFDRLYEMLIEQLSLHEIVADPTVTIVVKHGNNKNVTYSSWERFNVLRVQNHEITSEISLKLEFVINIPQTPQPQRCILNVNLDSSLPVLQTQEEDFDNAETLGLFIYLGREWKTVKVSIDFVDFLVAKSFVTVIEEWFQTLRGTPSKSLNNALLNNFQTLRSAVGQFGRIGMAAYLAAFVLFTNSSKVSLSEIILSVSIGLVIWALIVMVDSFATKKIFRRISTNIIPSVILLSETDNAVYREKILSLNSPTKTIAGFIAILISTILVNVFSSYLYSRLLDG